MYVCPVVNCTFTTRAGHLAQSHFSSHKFDNPFHAKCLQCPNYEAHNFNTFRSHLYHHARDNNNLNNREEEVEEVEEVQEVQEVQEVEEVEEVEEAQEAQEVQEVEANMEVDFIGNHINGNENFEEPNLNQNQNQINSNDLQQQKPDLDFHDKTLYETVRFLFHIQEEHFLFYKTRQDILLHVSNLIESSLQNTRNEILQRAEEHGVNLVQLENFFGEIEDVFQGNFIGEVDTSHKMERYFENNFQPIPHELVRIGVVEKNVNRNGVALREEVDRFGVRVPFLESLTRMLKNPQILHFIDHPILNQNGIMEDECDALLMDRKPILIAHPDALRIHLYYDEAEVTNALGTKNVTIGFFFSFLFFLNF